MATPKITLPGPAYIHYRAGRANIDRSIYPSLDEFWADLVAAYNKELRALYDAGCRYVQIDETSLVKLGDPRARQLLERARRQLAAICCASMSTRSTRVVAGAPADLQIAIHVCRSQDPSWQADVGYDPIADALFNQVNIGTYLLEYDNPRAGNFEPLRLLPKGKASCWVSSPRAIRGWRPIDELKRRIEEASKLHARSTSLALCPHCGFATSVTRSNDDAEALQWKKLRADRRHRTRGLGRGPDARARRPLHRRHADRGWRCGAARADAVEDFYKGRTISVYIASGPGGGYDAYGRLLGAIHRRASARPSADPCRRTCPVPVDARVANFLYNKAPQDGTAIGILQAPIIMDRLLYGDSAQGALYDPRKFSWIGSLDQFTPIAVVWNTLRHQNDRRRQGQRDQIRLLRWRCVGAALRQYPQHHARHEFRCDARL